MTALWLPGGRYRLPVSSAPAGSWALIEGIDASITKARDNNVIVITL